LTAERPDTGADCLTSRFIKKSASNAREILSANLSGTSCSCSQSRILKNIAKTVPLNSSRHGFNCSGRAHRAENLAKNDGRGNLSNFAQQLTKPAIRRKPCLRVYSRLTPHLAELFHFVLIDMDKLSVAIFVRHWRTFDRFSCSHEATTFISTRLRRRDMNPIAFSTDSCKSCHD
jgi:hypothetical protein